MKGIPKPSALKDYLEITGSCLKGTNEWYQNHEKLVKEVGGKMSVRELLVLLKNEYSYRDFSYFIKYQYSRRLEEKSIAEIHKIGGLEG